MQRLLQGAGKDEIKPGSLAGRLGTGARSQPRVPQQGRREVKDQDLRKNFEHSHGDHVCRCSTELSYRESHTGQKYMFVARAELPWFCGFLGMYVL